MHAQDSPTANANPQLPSPQSANAQNQDALFGKGALPDDGFIADRDAMESGGDDDDDDGAAKPADKKAGRRKIKIEFIQDKSRRHITFSKRKAGKSFLFSCFYSFIYPDAFGF